MKSASPELGLSDVKNQTKGNVVYLFSDASVNEDLPDGYISADNLLGKLIENEYDAKLVTKARKQIAKDFYSGEKSLPALRMKMGLSQRGLAHKADTTQSYIARIESGDADPGRKMMLKLCSALKIDMNQLNEALG